MAEGAPLPTMVGFTAQQRAPSEVQWLEGRGSAGCMAVVDRVGKYVILSSGLEEGGRHRGGRQLGQRKRLRITYLGWSGSCGKVSMVCEAADVSSSSYRWISRAPSRMDFRPGIPHSSIEGRPASPGSVRRRSGTGPLAWRKVVQGDMSVREGKGRDSLGAEERKRRRY